MPYSPAYIDAADGHLTRAFSALPWDLLAKGVIDLGQATNNDNDPGERAPRVAGRLPLLPCGSVLARGRGAGHWR